MCAACDAALPVLPAACPVCALPSPIGSPCGACLSHPPPFAATSAALLYLPPVDLLIHAFKFRGRLSLAPYLAERLAEALSRARAPRPDLVIPLPLSLARQRERGYNQAQELARRLARTFELPLDAHSAKRTGAAPAQADLPWKERAKNIRGAFVCAANVAGKHVAVVDDVMTTGATLSEFARALLKAGAARVSNWVVARTLPPAA